MNKLDVWHSELKTLEDAMYFEIYEVDVYCMLPSDVRDRVVIDIGAHRGLFSMRCLEMGAKKAYCFEPQQNNFMELLRLYGLFRKAMVSDAEIVPLRLAVLDGSVDSVRISNECQSSNIWKDHDSNEVNCISLAEARQMVREKDSEMILKLDCEGSEFEIIYNSPKDLLRSFSMIYIEIHDDINPKYINKSKELMTFIESLGFEFVRFGPQMGEWMPDGGFRPSSVCCAVFKSTAKKTS